MSPMQQAYNVPTIPPEMLEEIAHLIGDSFTFLQLDAILYRCTADRVINDYTSDTRPRRVIARNCLEGAERAGIMVNFLANILASTPNSSPLYAKIVEGVPQAENALPDIRAQLPDVISGLERAMTMLADPAARSAAHQSRTTLSAVNKGIFLLSGYKHLHDCLHTLQQVLHMLQQLSLLFASSTDDVQFDALREYKNLVRTAVETAKTEAEHLPSEATVRPVEMEWIDELDTAAKFFQKALDARSPAVAKIGIIRLSRVLEIHPPRLNDLIVAAAKDLPLKALSDALNKLAGQAGDVPELVQANVALINLDQALRSRVADHDMWQEFDKWIWVLEQLFSQSVNKLDDFTVGWSELKPSVRAMVDLSQDSEWSRNVRGYADSIDLELARLQTLAATARLAEKSLKGLRDIFADFSSEVRHHFFVINHQLKEDCDLLIEIGKPLQAILQEVSHD